MANCIVKRDGESNIVKVLDPNTGEESKVFNDIAKLPHVESLEKAVEIYNEVLKVNPEVQSVSEANEKAYRKWRGDNREVSGSEIGEIKSGEKVIVSVYHGTTHDFSVFDADINGNIEGHLGKVNYFTSNYGDASGNYLAEGADITGRVEQLKENIISELEAREYETFDEIYDYVSENYPEFDVSSLDKTTDFEEVANRVAQSELVGVEEKVMEINVKLDNPIVLGNNTTWAEVFPEELYEDSMEEALEAVAEEQGVTIEEAKEDYEHEVREKAIELEGVENYILESLQTALDNNSYSDVNAFEILEDMYESEVDLNEIEKKIRSGELYENNEAEIAGSQVIADFFEELGYDGIILNNVAERFQGMELDRYTSHVHVFNKNNTQIKSAEGDNVTFNPNESNIYYKLESEGKEHNSFKEALEETESDTINIVSNGKIVATIPSTLDERSTIGLINSLIVEDILDENKVVVGGETFYQIKGKDKMDSAIKEEFLKEELAGKVAKRNYKVKDGLITIKEDTLEPTEEGTTHRTVADNILDFFSGKTILSKKEKISERNLKLNLLTILSDMGVSLSSIKEYQDRFAKKNKDINPSAEALADIANRVVAYKEGLLSTENLTEEVMHFIVETLPQEKVDELQDLVRNSEEYAEHFEAYNKAYKGDQKLVEKEILGKILKNITLGKVQGKEQSFLEQVFNIIKDFFDNLTLSGKERVQLKELNKLVEDFVVQENGPKFNESSLSESKQIALMYSLGEDLDAGSTSLRKAVGQVAEDRQFSIYDRALNGKTFKDASKAELKSAVTLQIEATTRLVNTTREALKEAELNRRGLNAQNHSMLEDLHVEHSVRLATIASNAREVFDTQATALIEDKVKSLNTEIGELVTKRNNLNDKHVKENLETVLNQYGEKEQDVLRDTFEKALKGEMEDVGIIFSYFGQLHHASNPILNMIGKHIWDAKMRAVQGEREDIGPLHQMMEDYGFTDKDISKFMGDRGEILSQYNTPLAEDKEAEIQMNLYNEIKGLKGDKAFTDISVFKKAQYENDFVEYTIEEKGKHDIELQKRKMEFFNSPMNDLYYEDLAEKYSKDKLNISPVTVSTLRELASARRSVISGATRKDGKVIMSPKAKRDMIDIAKIRKARKNPYLVGSELKTGLEIKLEKPTGSSLEALEMKSGGYLVLDRSKASDDALVSFDMLKIDADYINSPNKKESNNTLFSNFVKYIQNLQYDYEVDTNKELNNIKGLKEGQRIFVKNEKTLYEVENGKLVQKSQGDFVNHSSQEIYDLIQNNVDVQLSRTFYDKQGEGGFLAGEELENLNPDKLKEVKALRKEAYKLSQLIAVHRNVSSPIEIDRMTASEQDEIKSLSSKVADLKRELTLPETEFSEDAEQTVNQAYRDYLYNQDIEEGTEAEIEHLKTSDHTRIDKTAFDDFTKNYINYTKGISLSKANKKKVERFKSETLEEAQLAYLRSGIHSYYKRYAPVGYKSVQERIKAGENPLLILASLQADENFDVVIDKSFEDNSEQVKYETFQEISGQKFTDLADFLKKVEDNQLKKLTPTQDKKYKETLYERGYIKNPDYNPNYEGGFLQPKKSAGLEDKRFQDLFAPNSKGEATKNKNLFAVRNEMIAVKKKAFEKQGARGVNPLKAVQVSKSFTQKIRDIFSATGNAKYKWNQVSEIFRETFAYRVDDKAYGEIDKSGNRVLVKYYTQELENQDDVSTDHMMALSMLVQRSNEHSAKKEVLSDVEGLHNVLIKNKRTNRGANMDKTIEMAESFIDSALYGKIEQVTKEIQIPGMDYSVDLAKIARSFVKYVSLKNLGFSAPIALTGFTTGYITKKVEEFIGEKMNKESAKFATQEFKKLRKDAISNATSFKVNDTSKLNLLMQAFGQYDMSSKARNAKYGGLQRAVSNSAMVVHQISDFPITPKIVIGMLDDNRFIKGKRYNRLQFFQEGLRSGESQALLESQWSEARKYSIYNNIELSSDGFTWNKEIYNQIGRNIDSNRYTKAQYRARKIKEALEENVKNGAKREEYLSENELREITEVVDNDWNNSKELEGTEEMTIEAKHAIEAFLEDSKGFVSRFIDNEVSNIQGQIPQHMKVTAQRHAIGSMVMLHKGFASIAMQRKFKKKHFNLDTGVYEQGTYRTLWDLMTDIAGNPFDSKKRAKGQKAFRDFFKPPTGENVTSEDWLDYELKVRNGKRLVKELGTVVSAAVIFSMIFAATEDDDNEETYLLGMTNYIMHRTLAETTSNLSFGIVKDAMGTAEKPLVPYNALIQIGSVWNAFDGEEIKQNKYKGLSKRQKYFIQNIPGVKALYDLHDAETLNQVSDTYRMYNDSGTRLSTFGTYIDWNKKDK